MSAQEYQDYLRKAGHRRADLPTFGASKKTPKYHNVKVYIYADGFVCNEKLDGHGGLKEKFDSVKEYNRCLELRLLEKAKKISNLCLQVPFLIHPAFTDGNGKKHRAVVYKADFTYEENGRVIVEDVKGYSKEKEKYLCTETFLLKWKLLQSLYPDKTFRLY